MRRSNLVFPFLSVLGFTVLTAAPPTAFGEGGGGAGGGATTTGGGGAGGGATTTGGTGGAIPCVADGLCDTPSEDCSCADCEPLALCHPGQCIADGVCDLKDECICVECHNNAFCADPSHCIDDGTCDPFNEGCVCTDCASRPECMGSSTSASASSTSTSSGSAGAGGQGGEGSGFVPSGEPSGCSLEPISGHSAPTLGILGALSALAWMVRRKRR